MFARYNEAIARIAYISTRLGSCKRNSPHSFARSAMLRPFSSGPGEADVQGDYFALLGLSRTFSVDGETLKQSYRKLITQHHPDLQKQNGQDEAVDDDHASRITHAYHTLKKPHTRATHLLELVGFPIDERSGEAKLVGPEFLMLVMETREVIDAIPSVFECGGDEGVIEQLESHLAEAKKEMDKLLQELDLVMEQDDFDKARQLAAQLQYWNRIEETIVEKL